MDELTYDFSRVGGGVFIVSANGDSVRILDEAEVEVSFYPNDISSKLIYSEELDDFLAEFQTGD